MPLNNAESRKTFVEIGEKLQSTLSQHSIPKRHGFYLSVLEHEWVIIVEAESAHDIETFCVDVDITTSTVKIFPLDNSVVLKKIKGSQPGCKS